MYANSKWTPTAEDKAKIDAVSRDLLKRPEQMSPPG